MNAQEALDELKTTRIYEVKSYFGNNKFTIEQDKDAVEAIQQLIDQANAKPKTLEELGWELSVEIKTKVVYDNAYRRILFDKEHNKVENWKSTYEEILAIAEKMKELGMTGEQIAKGETK